MNARSWRALWTFLPGRGRWRRRQFLAITVTYLAVVASAASAQTGQLWPEVDTYVKLSPGSRLFFSAQSTREDQATSQFDVGAHIDFFRKPLRKFRFLAPGTLDESKSQLLLLRVGYHYLVPLEEGGYAENRVVLEATPRYPVKFGITVADRNRADLRFIQGAFSWRYRNRISVERSLRIHSYAFNPYLRSEFWYESDCAKWSRTSLQIGSEFPIKKRFGIEGYFEHQNNTGGTPNQQVNGLGLILNLYF